MRSIYERMKRLALVLQALYIALCIGAMIWPADVALKAARTLSGAEEDMGSVVICFFALIALAFVTLKAIVRGVDRMRRIAKDELAPAQGLIPVGQIGTLAWLFPLCLVIAFGVGAYGRFIERSRFSEALTMASQIEKSQERYRRIAGSYVTNASDIANLDISFARPGPTFGMHNFILSVDAGSGTCPDDYRLVFQRCSKSTPGCDVHFAWPHPLYGAYRAVYDRCIGKLSIEDCPRCAADLLN